MRYNIDFCIVSLAFLLAITFYCFLRRRVTETREVIFRAMMITAVVAVSFDIITAIFDAYGANVPRLIIYFANFVYIASAQLGSVLFFVYSIVLSGWLPKFNKLVASLLSLPYLFIVIALLIAPFTENAIYYLGENNVYINGSLHGLIYATAAFYLIGSIIAVAAAKKKIAKVKRIVVMLFIFLTTSILSIQLLYSELLLNTTAYAFGILLLFLTLHSNSDQAEKRTKAVDSGKFDDVVDDLFSQNQKFDVIVYSQSGFRYINAAFGAKAGDAVLLFISDMLKKCYPKCFVYHIGGDDFAVVVHRQKQSSDSDNATAIMLPSSCNINGTTIQLSTRTVTIPCEICGTKEVFDNVLDYLMHEYRGNSGGIAVKIDDDFIAKMETRRSDEATLRDAVANDKLIMFLQPIVNTQGQIVAAEALARLVGENGSFIPPDTFIRIAEKNGLIDLLGEQMFCKLCSEYIESESVRNLEFVSVNVAVAQCMRDDFADRFATIAKKFGVPASKIHCEITETQAIDSVPTVRRNLLLLKSYGFHIVLDDFGSGYANFGYLTSLPVDYVKFDRKMLQNSMRDEQQKALFAGLSGLLTSMRITTVCEGIETDDQEAFAAELGIDLYQGYKYSRPICTSDFRLLCSRSR